MYSAYAFTNLKTDIVFYVRIYVTSYTMNVDQQDTGLRVR